MNKNISKLLVSFLPFATAIVLTFGMMYVGIQQLNRSIVNDQLVQVAEEGARDLSAQPNFQPQQPAIQFEMGKMLSPFVILFNAKGQTVYSEVVLNGKVPSIPQGVLETAKSKGENRLTWEPAAGVRAATVVTYYKGKGAEGYVLSGRSLREPETRIDNLTKMFAVGLLATLVLTFGAYTFVAESKTALKADSRKAKK